MFGKHPQIFIIIMCLTVCNARNLRRLRGEKADNDGRFSSEQMDNNNGRQLIINGEDANVGRYPWMVRYSYDGVLCGGSLIADDLVLTAAHCFSSDDKLGEAQISRYNIGSYSESYSNRQVVERFPHKKYKHGGSRYFNPSNDIAILKLSSPVIDVEPVKLNFDSSLPPVGDGNAADSLLMLGWGSTNNGVGVSMRRSDILQEAPTHYVPFEECAVASDPTTGLLYGYSPKRTVVKGDWLCTQNIDAASCNGDSGGPIIIPRASSDEADILVGLISSSLGGCDNEYLPQINQRISYHMEWIKIVGCEESSNPPAEWECPGTRAIITPEVAEARMVDIVDVSDFPSDAPSLAPSAPN